ncbi:MAG: hypothetical protein LUG18_15845 [Candidatus Azobacteroides sp.]|nr:hypothetical protein [Candidatus Azobacteroides sp.]
MRDKIVLFAILLFSATCFTYGYEAEQKSDKETFSPGEIWIKGIPVVTENKKLKENVFFTSHQYENNLSLGKDDDISLSAPPPGVSDPPQKVSVGKLEILIYFLLFLFTSAMYKLKNQVHKKKNLSYHGSKCLN